MEHENSMVLELGLTVYHLIIILLGVIGSVWGLVKFILLRQEAEDRRVSDKLVYETTRLDKQISGIKEDYIRREEFEREMNRFNSSLTSVRDEVISSNASTSRSLTSLTQRIDSWMLSQSKEK